MMRWLLAAGCLAGLAAVICLLQRRFPGWTEYPGFRFSVRQEKKPAGWTPEQAPMIPYLTVGVFLAAAALALCGNSLTELAGLRAVLTALPAVLLLAQEGELLCALALCLGRDRQRLYDLLYHVKWLLLILWLFGLFACLMVRAALL